MKSKLSKEELEFAKELRDKVKSGMTTWYHAKCLFNEKFNYDLSTNAFRLRCEHYFKDELITDSEVVINEAEVAEGRFAENLKVRRNSNGDIEASQLFDKDISKLSNDELLIELGYDPNLWNLDFIQYSTWDQKSNKGDKVLYAIKYKLSPKIEKLTETDYKELADSVFNSAESIELATTGYNRRNDQSRLLVIPPIEAHLGKISEMDSTNKCYNLDIAIKRCKIIYGKVIEELTSSGNYYEEVLLVIGGDLFNSEFNNKTFNGTSIQNSNGYKTLFSKALEFYEVFIRGLLSSGVFVNISLCEGNHDRATSYYLYQALVSRFCDCDNVAFDKDTSGTSAFSHGNSLLVFDHGDVDKKRLVESIPALYPVQWSSSDYHYLLVGHLHKMDAETFSNGVQLIRVPSPCENDAWHFINKFGSGVVPSFCYFTVDYDDGITDYHFIKF